jgi:glycosyltransferase involved in cell wall biosynthesis
MCLLEAMAARKAVIATSVGDIPRIIIPGKTGLLIQSGNPDSLCSAMRRLVEDVEFRSRLAAAGYELAKECFSAEAMASRYLSIYAQATQARQPSPAVKHAREVGIHE